MSEPNCPTSDQPLPAPPAAAQGGRSPTGAAAGGAGAPPPPPPRRWHAARKAEAVLRLLRGESLDALSRELALPIARLEAWREEGLAGLRAGLCSRPDADPVQLRLDEANRRLGELSMENELLRIKAARALPFPARRSLK
jgi:hypothetical protein